MPDIAFPWTSDVERRVRNLVNQPKDRRGAQPTWSDEEFSNALNRAYKWLYRRISNMDLKFQTTTSDVTIPTNTTNYALPASTSSLRLAMVMRNGHADWPIEAGRPEDEGQFLLGRRAYFIPDQNVLHFTTPTNGPLTVRLIYGSYYIPLVHGPVIQGGGTSAQFPDWFPIDSNIFNGLALIVSEGTGVGQTNTAGNYAGAIRSLSVTAWAPAVPDETSFIASRPDLPLWAEDVYENKTAAILYEKTSETQKIREANAFVEDAFKDFETQLKTQERRSPSYTYDANLNGGWSDPANVYNY